jgi:hypothetical protein
VTADIFAEWLRRQGHHVVRTASSYWYDQGPRCYQAFPYHWVINPPGEELSQFLRQNRALSLRYSAPLDAPAGRISYHMVYARPTYDFEDLGKWARKNVRRGMRSCSVEPINFERLADEGWSLQQDTLDRQQRSAPISQAAWRNLCGAAASLPGFEAWGALVSNQLAASVITSRIHECCYMLYQQCRREHLPEHVNNALSFKVTQTMLGHPSIHSVFYGLHSLDAPSSIDEFKLRMGYAAKPVRQRVAFHPWCSPLANPVTHRMLNGLLALRPSSRILAKGEGMMRFFLEGKQPIERQSVPEVLAMSQEGRELPLLPGAPAHLHL